MNKKNIAWTVTILILIGLFLFGLHEVKKTVLPVSAPTQTVQESVANTPVTFPSGETPNPQAKG